MSGSKTGVRRAADSTEQFELGFVDACELLRGKGSKMALLGVEECQPDELDIRPRSRLV